MSPRLIATWKFGDYQHRLVEVREDNYTIERCDRNTPGIELWTPIYETAGVRLRDGGQHSYALKCLIAGVEYLAQIKPAGYREG